MMRIRNLLFGMIFCFSCSALFCEESVEGIKKFDDEKAKVIKEEATEEIRATIRVPDTNAFMGRKKTEITDDYRNFLMQKLIKSNKSLYK